MVSNVRELFRRGARDETFGPEMGVISMLVKLEGVLKGPDLSVMPGFVPAIHVLFIWLLQARGCPARPGMAMHREKKLYAR
jgi:hypothetical protein